MPWTCNVQLLNLHGMFLDYEDAHSTEMTNMTKHPVIDLMEEQKGCN